MTDLSPILEVRDLAVEFRQGDTVFPAVQQVSFSLKPGQTLGIVGESGSGKSVTSLSIMRLIPEPPGRIAGGSILFHENGQSTDLLGLTDREMCAYRGNKIAMVFQEPMTSLNPVYTCGRQVAEAIRLHQHLSRREAREQTLDWFNEVMLPRPGDIFTAYPHQLSGGQKQRVMIAMAMCCNPSVLIADEPTTALDVTLQKTILGLIRSLQDKYRMSVLFITHDLGVVAEIAHEVQVMYRGRIVESGSAAQIFNHPQQAYTRGLIACRPDPARRLRTLPTVSDFMEKAIGETEAALLTEKYVVSSEERMLQHAALYNREPLLKVEKLKLHYPLRHSWRGKVLESVKALDEVSLEVYPGETLGLVGESGCGKTTLGRSILRLIQADSGRIWYRDQELSALKGAPLRALRARMQIIFQDPYSSLNPRMMIGRALTEPMRVHGLGRNSAERRKTVIGLLERVGLEEAHFYRYPHEFSGGQRQRICIARALALQPEFIVCDESVSALDVSVQAQVLNLLNELKREYNFTYIFISHDLSVVKFMSDRMVVMQNGRVVEMGEADQVYRNPAHPYTRLLIDAIPKGLKDNTQSAQQGTY